MNDQTISSDNPPPRVSPRAPIVLRGRIFTEQDLEVIGKCVRDYFEQGRTRISQVVCERLNWKQPNGWLKERACRDVLRHLESRGYVALPAPLASRVVRPAIPALKSDPLTKIDLVTPITKMPSSIRFEFAKGNKNERVWNALVQKFHYLGHETTVGRSIKYLIYGDERIVGAIGFSSPAWNVASRDLVLDKLGFDQAKKNDFLINNSRFLILPFVRVPHMASKILSLATCEVAGDWEVYYALRPLIVETFVQPSLYKGTSYKAANWLVVGLTSGYAKRGALHHNSQEPKMVLLYGLNAGIRHKLTRVVRQMSLTQDSIKEPRESSRIA